MGDAKNLWDDIYRHVDHDGDAEEWAIIPEIQRALNAAYASGFAACREAAVRRMEDQAPRGPHGLISIKVAAHCIRSLKATEGER